ncbi:hypothetical protein, partial [Planifilum fimeticola]|uniref:hypothetical protein n=1 Tax=Planifilum fimeticola TaxID=201975 RepID=UPI001B8043C9
VQSQPIVRLSAHVSYSYFHFTLADHVFEIACKLGKGLAIADIAISGGETIFHTYKAFTTDGQESTDYAFKALASGGSALFSAGVLVGPTPVGVGLMVVGGIAWGIGTIYKHRDTIKKVANKAKDAVKSAWNTVKG